MSVRSQREAAVATAITQIRALASAPTFDRPALDEILALVRGLAMQTQFWGADQLPTPRTMSVRRAI